MARPADGDIAALLRRAEAQHGVFTRAQARALGVTAKVVRTRQRGGEWVAYRGVLRVATTPDDDEARSWAALLRAGTGAELTGPSALRVHGVDVPAPVPVVRVPVARNVLVPSAIVIREATEPWVIGFHREFLVAPLHRALVDSMRLLPYDQALDLADQLHGRDVDVTAPLERWLATASGTRGAPQARRILDEVGAGARSRAERRMHALLRHGRLSGWSANAPVYDGAGLIGYVDVGFAAARLAIEIDGRAWHSGRDRFQRDRTRHNRLVRAGWTVLHFTWADLRERPHEVIAVISDTLRRLRAA